MCARAGSRGKQKKLVGGKGEKTAQRDGWEA